MNIKLATAASVVALTVSSAAWAQQTPPAEERPSPAITTPNTSAPAAAPPAAEATSPAMPSAGKDITFLPMQDKNQRLSSEWTGLAVKNAANESLGNVKDLVLDNDGKVIAVVVGVGGFLGIGEKAVAIPFDNVKVSTDANGRQVAQLNVTREALDAAPRFVTVQGQKSDQEAQARKTAPQGNPATPPASGRN